MPSHCSQGPTFGFVGFALTDRTQMQILGHPIRFDYHPTDTELRLSVARYLGALRNATVALKKYYTTEIPRLEHLQSTPDQYERPSQIFPCYTTYTSLEGGTKHEISYLAHPISSKLIFFGKAEGVEVCVKFVRQYSKEAHQFCDSLGIAPRLRGFEALPGGWFMVVMDRIEKDYVTLANRSVLRTAKLMEAIRAKLELLHQAEFVHGDLRDCNVMVKGTLFMLVDFDFSGKIGIVVYPMNTNRSIWRPEDAIDGKMIKADHDIQMLRFIFQETTMR